MTQLLCRYRQDRRSYLPCVWFVALLLLLPGLFSCSTPADSAASGNSQIPEQVLDLFDLDWALDPLWEDGKAEVGLYEAERVIYGKPRHFEFSQLTVKEDFNREHQVKTEDYSRRDLFPVMKVNQFARVPTDQYPYHFLSSLFFRRENPVQLYKMTVGSQEWCGNTFKSFIGEGNYYRFTYHSYWDGEGEGQKQLEQDLFFEDQLPYTLRSLRFREGLQWVAKVAENQQTNKARVPEVYQAQFRVDAAEPPADKPAIAAWRVEVRLDEKKTNNYWFSRTYPHPLLRLRTWDGRKLDLKSLERQAYWQN
jgi:hypothetical protein